jgi:hypothetical protein
MAILSILAYGGNKRPQYPDIKLFIKNLQYCNSFIFMLKVLLKISTSCTFLFCFMVFGQAEYLRICKRGDILDVLCTSTLPHLPPLWVPLYRRMLGSNPGLFLALPVRRCSNHSARSYPHSAVLLFFKIYHLWPVYLSSLRILRI